MDFTVHEKMQAVIGMMAEFIEKELIPLEPEFLTKDFKAMLPELAEKRRMVKQMELWAPNHPKEFGGMGLDLMDHALVSEVLGRSPLGHYIFGCQAPDAGNIEILHKYGTEKQQRKISEAPGGREYPELLFHDGSGDSGLQSRHDGYNSNQRRQ